jgi:hypothetical protein
VSRRAGEIAEQQRAARFDDIAEERAARQFARPFFRRGGAAVVPIRIIHGLSSSSFDGARQRVRYPPSTGIVAPLM